MPLDQQALTELKAHAKRGEMPSPRMFWELADALERAWLRMPTFTEVYALAVEDKHVWVLDPPRPWMSGEVQEVSEPDTAAKRLLFQHDALDLDRGAIHQTSCRTEIIEATGRSFQVNTFLAAVPLDGPILRAWPTAEPITERLIEQLGPPEPHGAMEVPWVSDGAVLEHGLGVYAELMGTSVRADAETAAKLERLGWREPMAGVAEQMFRHFRRVHQAA